MPRYTTQGSRTLEQCYQARDLRGRVFASVVGSPKFLGAVYRVYGGPVRRAGARILEIKWYNTNLRRGKDGEPAFGSMEILSFEEHRGDTELPLEPRHGGRLRPLKKMARR